MNKTIHNKTSTTVTFSALMRIGSDPASSNGTVSIVTPPHTKISDEEEFVNGVTLAWLSTEEGANADQFQQVTTRGSAWDDLLNTNSVLTIESTKTLDAIGSNTGVSSAGEGNKKIVNESGQDFYVKLLTREGDDPANPGPTVPARGPGYFIPKGGSGVFSYPGPFLNGLTIYWSGTGSHASQSTTVTTRGGSWDDTLNTNDTITIRSVSGPDLSGSN